MWPWRRRTGEDFREEIRANLTLDTDRFVAEGLAADEARKAALRAFGNVTRAQEQFYESGRLVWLDDLQRDVRYALRSLIRNPGFTMIAVLTLALGIGANTAIFSVVNAVVLRPLPFKDADRLVRAVENVPASETLDETPRRVPLPLHEVLELRRAQSFSHVGVYIGTDGRLSNREGEITLQGAQISPAVLPMLGGQTVIGRLFNARDEVAGADPVVVLSYPAWRGAFDADPHILRRTLTVNRQAYSVIGVMAPEFTFLNSDTQFWVPIVLRAAPAGRVTFSGNIARLRDGVSRETASAEVSALLQQVRGEPPIEMSSPQPDQPRFEIVTIQDQLVAPVLPALRVLVVAVGLVLLIACVNVANLLLARSATREGEMAVRSTLGAGTGRLIRQGLTESALLAVLGGAAGSVFALGGIRLFRHLGASVLQRSDLSPSTTFPRLHEIGLDASVFALTAVVSVVTGLLFGLAPAARTACRDIGNALRTGATGSVHAIDLRRTNALRSLLVCAELMMATMLLVGSGLLINSFVRLSTVRLGFDPTNVLTFQVRWPSDRYAVAEVNALAEDLVAQVRRMSSVSAAGYGWQLPMVQRQQITAVKTMRGEQLRPLPEPGATSEHFPDLRLVSRDYLRVMGTRVIAGRGFGDNDRAGQPRVMLINETMARRRFPGTNPIGQRLYALDDRGWEIVGIIEDAKQKGLQEDAVPQILVDFRQWPRKVPLFDMPQYYAVRLHSDELATVIPAIRRIVRTLDAQADVDNVAMMEQLVSASISRQRLYAVFLGIFAGMAGTLAAIGVYGVTAYSVTQRTKEMGIRMALGAPSREVLGLMLRQAVLLSAGGVVFGLAAAAGLTRYLQGMLFGLAPLDPSTFIAVSLMFVVVVMLASYIPARRASNVEPMVALRRE